MALTARFLMPAELARRSACVRLDIKSLDDDGAFEGYASLFGREDLGRDVMMPGAFRDSLTARGPTRIKMLFQHDPAEPIGVWDDIREDAKGLYVRGRLTLAVARAREVLALMRAGALDGLSIGFKAVKARRDAKSGVRRIEAADLWEISIVTFPMLQEARVEARGGARLAISGDASLAARVRAATRMLKSATAHQIPSSRRRPGRRRASGLDGSPPSRG